MQNLILSEFFQYGLYLALCAIFSMAINYLFLKFSRNLGVRNTQEIRWSSVVKPSIGGISFYIIFLISVSIASTFASTTFLNQGMVGMIAAVSLGFMIGLADDAFNTNPILKLLGQLTCAFLLILGDVYIELTDIPSINFTITVIWVIGLMNSINMLDNMDAITGSVSVSIIAMALGLALFHPGSDIGLNFLLVGVLGSLIGFLIYNWNPASMYMGDTGSQFLGVFLAAIGILYFWDPIFKDAAGPQLQLRHFIIPILAFIVPIIDTGTVVIHRLLKKQSPFVGGRDHVTHHLAYLGLSDRQVALVLLVVSLTSFPLILWLALNDVQWTAGVTAIALGYCLFLFCLTQLLYLKGKERQNTRTLRVEGKSKQRTG